MWYLDLSRSVPSVGALERTVFMCVRFRTVHWGSLNCFVCVCGCVCVCVCVVVCVSVNVCVSVVFVCVYK